MSESPLPGPLSDTDRLWLLSSPLPWPLGPLARHCWLVVQRAGERPQRWEVWQRAELKPPSWGHVHRDLCGPLSGMAYLPFGRLGRSAWAARVEAFTEGAQAAQVACFLAQQGPSYPYKHRYLPLPGPNSNGFIAWVLHSCGVEWRLPPTAWGKQHYPRGASN